MKKFGIILELELQLLKFFFKLVKISEKGGTILFYIFFKIYFYLFYLSLKSDYILVAWDEFFWDSIFLFELDEFFWDSVLIFLLEFIRDSELIFCLF